MLHELKHNELHDEMHPKGNKSIFRLGASHKSSQYSSEFIKNETGDMGFSHLEEKQTKIGIQLQQIHC